MKTSTLLPVTLARMAKRKSGGEHVTQRKPVQIPIEWYKLAFKLASAQRQPMLWYLLSRIAADAEEAGLPRPRLPWEDDEE